MSQGRSNRYDIGPMGPTKTLTSLGELEPCRSQAQSVPCHPLRTLTQHWQERLISYAPDVPQAGSANGLSTSRPSLRSGELRSHLQNTAGSQWRISPLPTHFTPTYCFAVMPPRGFGCPQAPGATRGFTSVEPRFLRSTVVGARTECKQVLLAPVELQGAENFGSQPSRR